MRAQWGEKERTQSVKQAKREYIMTSPTLTRTLVKKQRLARSYLLDSHVLLSLFCYFHDSSLQKGSN